MEILTRPEARARGLKTYYTGRICKNGHDAYRYTQSGTCSDCVKAANNVDVSVDMNARKAIKDQMVMIKLRGFMEDRDLLAATAYCMAISRAPELMPGDVDPKLLPQGKDDAGTALFTFACFSDDIAALRDIANKAIMARPFDMAAARAKAFSEAQRWP